MKGVEEAMRVEQIDGQPSSLWSMHATLVAVATAFLGDSHRSTCGERTRLLFARMDCHGVGEDLNQVVRAFAIAVSQQRQLVLMPPSHEFAREICNLPPAIAPSAQQPWHWLVGLDDLKLDTIIVQSACQTTLEQQRPELLEALARSSEGNVSAVAASLGAVDIAANSRDIQLASSKTWRAHVSLSRHVPRIFQRQGLLWWFQVLTTYLIRIRGPHWVKALEAHPAMRPYLERGLTGGAEPVQAASLRQRLSAFRWNGWSVKCGRAGCDGIGQGWLPPVRFDVGIHVRIGDSCRMVRKRYQKLRGCGRNLSAALSIVRGRGVHGGTLFVASDSQAIIDEVDRGVARPFAASYLLINRSRFETTTPTEKIELLARRRASLLEALLDLLLLSRSTLLVGKMMSNFPRLAMQLHVQMPAARGSNSSSYIALDGLPWCTRSSCRTTPQSRGAVQRARQQELARNPPLDGLLSSE